MTVTQAVITSVSISENIPETALPILYDSIDTDALEAVFAGRGRSHISFLYSNSLVEIYNREDLTVEPAGTVSK